MNVARVKDVKDDLEGASRQMLLPNSEKMEVFDEVHHLVGDVK